MTSSTNPSLGWDLPSLCIKTKAGSKYSSIPALFLLIRSSIWFLKESNTSFCSGVNSEVETKVNVAIPPSINFLELFLRRD